MAKKKVTKKKVTKKTSTKTSKKGTQKATKKAAKKRATGKKISKTKTAAPHKAAEAATKAHIGVGQSLPAFKIHATGGKTITSQDLKGKRVVLYFYPKDSTPGCTIEGHEFTRLHDQFQAANTQVFGVSRDDLKSHEKFKSKENFCFDLLSDETGELSELFGVWKEKSMYGRTYMGIERSTFIIDENGILRKEWRAVKVDGHAEEVLKSIQMMSKG